MLQSQRRENQPEPRRLAPRIADLKDGKTAGPSSAPNNPTHRTTISDFAASLGASERSAQRLDTALVQFRRTVLQRQALGEERDGQPTQALVARGFEGAGGPLPHLDILQPLFGDHDLGGVRAFTGAAASEATEALGATGYASGDRVALASTDLFTVAHEAAHTVQQRAGRGATDDPALERHADTVAAAVVRGESAAPYLAEVTGGSGAAAAAAVQYKRKPKSCKKERAGEGSLKERLHATSQDLSKDGLTPIQGVFRALGEDAAQRKVLRALRTNAEFEALFGWFQRFPGGNPLRFKIQPGILGENGDELFGEYDPNRFILKVNPTKQEHLDNPQELVETLVHELIHAALHIHKVCLEKNWCPPRLPFAREVKDLLNDPMADRRRLPDDYPTRRAKATYERKEGDSKGDTWRKARKRRYMEENYGDSDSSPKTHYNDINHAAKALIIRIITDNLKRTRIGKETLAFVNARVRARLIQSNKKKDARRKKRVDKKNNNTSKGNPRP